jgi:HrpA-like RNA helicase
MPGVVEISEVCRRLQRSSMGRAGVILPLHSALPPQEQRKVFA